jgi:hypothetical protein
MATAKAIVGIDYPDYAWVEIEDSEGARWTYRKGAFAYAPTVCHVNLAPNLPNSQPRLPIDSDGLALLRQEGPGLPPTAIVRVESAEADGAGLGIPVIRAGGSKAYEYNRS